FPDLRQGILHPNLHVQWGRISGHFSTEALADLEHCADRLADDFPEIEIPPDEVKGLREEVDSFFEAVRSANIDAEFKIVLLDLIETIRQKIAAYEIRGAAAFRESLEASAGKIVFNSKSFEEPVNRAWKDRLVHVLKLVDACYAKAIKYRPLLEQAVPYVTQLLLGSGSH